MKPKAKPNLSEAPMHSRVRVRYSSARERGNVESLFFKKHPTIMIPGKRRKVTHVQKASIRHKQEKKSPFQAAALYFLQYAMHDRSAQMSKTVAQPV
ncbi:hypothetical protein FJTKL_00550 [Diaporthe vaccinii]|uniref:Uncharacterized protein n=1 Tax=Diaporthe vaccinii TaxID=105482 RepID=A0ABR4F5N0_9PEZI